MDERVVMEFAAMTYKPNIIGYSMTSEELTALRRYLRRNRSKHKECESWLRYFRDFIPSDKPDKDGEFTLDDCDDGCRFGAFCRQLLALNGIIISI